MGDYTGECNDIMSVFPKAQSCGKVALDLN